MTKFVEILSRVNTNPYSAFFYSPLKTGGEDSYYFSEPDEIYRVEELEQTEAFLARLDAIRGNNIFAYTIFPYELGFLFEKKLKRLLTKEDERIIKEESLIVTYNKRNVKKIKTGDLDFRGIEKNVTSISNFRLNESKKSFLTKIEAIKRQIAEGETYQVNLTTTGTFQFKGKIEKLFYDLMLKQSAEYSAFINLPSKKILSFSPELFFKLEGNKITAKPMKGTAHRGRALQEDMQQKEELFLSEKNRAENLMIVDLLRNDLGKVSRQNSVVVKKLFEIEKYESLFQMISVIKSSLKNQTKLSGLVKSIFPCGSITGAPKMRTMEIIHRLEKTPRGIYTGSIGLLIPGESIFNVAIRTLEIDKSTNKGNIGLGAGITWSSDANEEYNEVLSKGVFLTQPASEFEIFTSILYAGGKPFLLKEHLQRLKKSSEYFLFYYDNEKVIKELNRVFSTLNDKKYFKIKAALNKFGKITVTKTELRNNQQRSGGARIVISEKKIDAHNSFQYFKTTQRELYNAELQFYKKEGFDEVVFRNEKNYIAEGSVTNIFIFNEGKWKTPPIASGVLDGIYRKYFMKHHLVSEENISIADLKKSEKIILTNAVRKEIAVEEIVFNGSRIFHRK